MFHLEKRSEQIIEDTYTIIYIHMAGNRIIRDKQLNRLSQHMVYKSIIMSYIHQ